MTDSTKIQTKKEQHRPGIEVNENLTFYKVVKTYDLWYTKGQIR